MLIDIIHVDGRVAMRLHVIYLVRPLVARIQNLPPQLLYYVARLIPELLHGFACIFELIEHIRRVGQGFVVTAVHFLGGRFPFFFFVGWGVVYLFQGDPKKNGSEPPKKRKPCSTSPPPPPPISNNVKYSGSGSGARFFFYQR